MCEQLLKNKVAIVTGASSGIGKETALLFAQEGAAVTVTGRNEKVLNEVCDIITKDGGEALAVPADLTKYDSLKPAH